MKRTSETDDTFTQLPSTTVIMFVGDKFSLFMQFTDILHIRKFYYMQQSLQQTKLVGLLGVLLTTY